MGNKLRYSVEVTYSQTTPESASNGEHSKLGWTQSCQRTDLRGAVETVKEYYVSLDNLGKDCLSQSLYSSESTIIDYNTYTGEEQAVHISIDRRFKNKARAAHWLYYALNKCL